MRKLYCDRCKKNVKGLHIVDVPDKPRENGNYAKKQVELCPDCKSFVEKAAKRFNEAMTATRISFYEALLTMPENKESKNEDGYRNV